MNLHDDIDRLNKKVPYGKVFFTLSNDQGLTRSAHASYVNSIGKYSSNITARFAINKILDDIEHDKKSGGAISITIHPRDGIITQVTVQNTDRLTFNY